MTKYGGGAECVVDDVFALYIVDVSGLGSRYQGATGGSGR